MCLPLIGAAIGIAGTIASANAQSQSYKTQAAYADRQAVMTDQKGAYEGARVSDQNDRKLADIRGQYLSSGIALDGSVSDVLLDSATQASLDEQAIKYGTQVQKDNLKFEAGMARMNAKNAMAGGILGALATGVNAFTSISQQSQQRTMISNPYVNAGYRNMPLGSI